MRTKPSSRAARSPAKSRPTDQLRAEVKADEKKARGDLSQQVRQVDRKCEAYWRMSKDWRDTALERYNEQEKEASDARAQLLREEKEHEYQIRNVYINFDERLTRIAGRVKMGIVVAIFWLYGMSIFFLATYKTPRVAPRKRWRPGAQTPPGADYLARQIGHTLADTSNWLLACYIFYQIMTRYRERNWWTVLWVSAYFLALFADVSEYGKHHPLLSSWLVACADTVRAFFTV